MITLELIDIIFLSASVASGCSYPCSAIHTIAQIIQVATDSRIIMVERDILLLKGDNPIEKRLAAERLGEARERAAVPALIAALEDKNSNVCAWAAWALGRIKDPQAVDPLIRALDDHLKLAKTARTDRETKCVPDLYLALESITGKKHGMDINKWKEYQKSIRADKERPNPK